MPSHYSETELVNAHSHSSHNLEEVQKSSDCGCFSCLKIFSPAEVTEWLADGTVVCPFCAVDSILGSMSGCPLTKDFLAEMNGRWFRKITRPPRQKNARNAIAVVVTFIVLISNIILPNNIWVLILGILGFVAVFMITIYYKLMIRRRLGASKGLEPGKYT